MKIFHGSVMSRASSRPMDHWRALTGLFFL